VKLIVSACEVTSDVNKVGFALKALTLTDLTTLAGDDCTSNVERLCIRAGYPFYKHSIPNDSNEFLKKLHVAAVCVYPTKVKDAYNTLKRLNMLENIQIASGMNV
jgi:deoxyribose-phosphate aldolase